MKTCNPIQCPWRKQSEKLFGKSTSTNNQSCVRDDRKRLRYVVIDSDSFFIRPFGKKDFLREDGVPFTIMHKCEDLLGFCEAKGMHFVHTNYKKERIKLQGLFGRTGEIYDFGPTPVVWGTEVWQMLKEDYLDKNNVCLAALILKYPSELLVYGEALSNINHSRSAPRNPFLKSFITESNSKLWKMRTNQRQPFRKIILVLYFSPIGTRMRSISV